MWNFTKFRVSVGSMYVKNLQFQEKEFEPLVFESKYFSYRRKSKIFIVKKKFQKSSLCYIFKVKISTHLLQIENILSMQEYEYV